jgi:hypothetical protein
MEELDQGAARLVDLKYGLAKKAVASDEQLVARKKQIPHPLSRIRDDKLN